MKFTEEENKYFEKFREIGMDKHDASLFARLKCVQENFPDCSIEQILDQTSEFYQHCIKSGRFTQSELNYFCSRSNIIFHDLSGDFSYQSIGVFSHPYNLFRELAKLFINIFNNK